MRGKELRNIRDGLGLSQAEMAMKLGVHPNTVARWERDQVSMGATAEILIQELHSQRERAPGGSVLGAVVLDEHHRRILLALKEHIDPEVFEQCAVDLIGKSGLSVVPVVGGGDGGFDGSVVDVDSGHPIPLVVTTSTGDAAKRNLTSSLKSAKRQNPALDRAFFATSSSLKPRERRKLEQAAAVEDVQLMQVYDQTWFAQELYRDPVWCKKLLGLTSKHRALSRFPIGTRPIRSDYVVGRSGAIEWLQSQTGDCLLIGVPGSGKTFLLSSVVDELDALFVVDNSNELIADDIRELSPKAVILDDVHTDIRTLKSLIQLRANIHADDLRIIVTSWPGYEGEAANLLALPDSSMHELGLIDANEMIDVIKAHGVTGPDRLLSLIRQQAGGKPGLAGTLAALVLAGDAGKVLGGDALLDQLAPSLISMLGEDAITLLAYFALGGKAGADPEQFAAQSGESVITIHSRLAKLAAAGVFHPLPDRRIVIVPEALRVALVRRVFLGQAGPNYRQALDWVANRHEGIITLIRASARGTRVPDLWDLLRTTNSETLWAEYAKLGEQEALYVIEKELCRYEIVAEQGLHYVPEVMIPILLDRMPEPWPTFGAENHPAVRALREWTVDRDDNFPRNEIAIRRALVKATRKWWNQSGRTHQAIHVMSLALKPNYRVRGMDPGAGTTLTLRSYLHPRSVLEAQVELWADVLDLVSQAQVVPWELLLSLAGSWLQADGVARDVSDEMRRFSEKILGDLARATEEHPGLQSKLNHRARAWGFEIDVLLDPLYEAAFFQEGPFTPEEDERRAVRFVRMVENSPRSLLADRLVHLSRERDYAGHSGDGFVFPRACRMLARRMPDLVTFVEDLVARGARPELVDPFFQEAASVTLKGFDSLVSQFLDNPDFEPLVVRHLLMSEDTSSPRVADALERARRYPFMLSNMAEFGRLNSEATRLLLTGSDELLATTAAAGYHLRGLPVEGGSTYGAWRDAVVRSARFIDIGDAQTGWLIKEILKKDPELAKDWLLEWMVSGRHWLDMHDDCAAIASGMTRDQRLYILERIDDRPLIGLDDIVRQLVGDDLELFAQALRMDNLSDYRAPLLAGRPDELWLKKATLAIEAGLSLGEIAEASYMSSMMWWGEESKMWAEWRQDFERLAETEIDDPQLVRLLQIAIRGIQRRERNAMARESREAIHGFGEW